MKPDAFARLWGLIVLLGFIDVGLTALALAGGEREWHPLMQWLHAADPWQQFLALTTLKALQLIALAYLFTLTWRYAPRLVAPAAWSAATFLGGVAVWTATMARHDAWIWGSLVFIAASLTVVAWLDWRETHTWIPVTSPQ